jgi:copper chaperone
MSIQTKQIKVSGMTCGHCEMAVNRAVKTLGDAIIDVKADKDSGTATVSYDDSKVSEEQIKAAVNETGIYEAA